MYDRGEIMSEKERLEILKFIYSDTFIFNILSYNRADSKISLDDKKLPIAIWKIKQRLLDREDLREFRSDPNFEDIITIIFPGGGIHPHTDPNGIDFTFHTRFNVFLQIPDKFNTFYGEEMIDAKERHYVMCRSGIDVHQSVINNTAIPRIALSFGFMLPISKILKLYKVPNRVETDFYLKILYSIVYIHFFSPSQAKLFYPETKKLTKPEIPFTTLLKDILEE